MAGDWIKMRTDLRDDPAVIAVAATLGIEEDAVVGKLHRLWSWADQHTVDGCAKSNAAAVTQLWLDRYVGAPGFSAALAAAGWLTISDSCISIPKFEAHNGETGKRRSLTAKRAVVRRSKSNANSNAASVTEALPREEKRREDSNTSASAEVCKETVASDRSSPVRLVFPTEGKAGKSWSLTQAKIDEYQETYPSLDVLAECRKALQYVRDNPAKRKTVGGMPAYLTGWMNRSVNGARAGPAADARGSVDIKSMDLGLDP